MKKILKSKLKGGIKMSDEFKENIDIKPELTFEPFQEEVAIY